MSKRCLIKGCEKDVSDGYAFPEKQADCTKWVEALKEHQKLPDDYKTQIICADHFTPTDFLASRGKKKNLSKKAVPSVFPEVTDNDDTSNEENGFQNESIEIKEEDISNDEDEEMQDDSEAEEAIGSDDSDFEPDDGSEDMSGDEKRSRGSQYQQSIDESQDSERTTTERDSAFAFQPNQKDDDADSDYEPVTERDIGTLQAKITEKTSGLVREKCNLKCIEEKLRNRATTIKKLEAELLEFPGGGGSQNGELPKPVVGDYTNPELRRFAISLYYFSPKVYAYMGSLIPYLPPKEVVLDWVKSGQATAIFPEGVLIKENFTQE